MKVSSSSKKEPNPKVEKMREKYLAARQEISVLRQLNRKERKKTKAAIASRDNWKGKNRVKVNVIKGLKRKIERGDKPSRHHFSMAIIKLSVLLRVHCGCSYRSTVKVLQVLQLCLLLEMERIPCSNTVENWVSKMGLNRMNTAITRMEKKSQEVCLILDENLKVSNERVLMMLLTTSEKEKKEKKEKKKKGLRHTDVEVAYMGGKKSWTGEKIKKQVLQLLEDSPLKIGYILSDEDSKLLRATRLLGVPHLPDINHAIANCLRKIFKKNETYQGFIKLLGGFSSKSVNQSLTYLRPPKQRTKARFMNQKAIIQWALTLLERFDKLNDKEQLFFNELKRYQGFLTMMKGCIELSEQVIKPLKEDGLCQETLAGFKEKIKGIKEQKEQKEQKQEHLIKEFAGLLEKYSKQYEVFLGKKTGCYNVSSDVIESLFGKQKHLVSDNPLVGVSLLDLELPVHCMTTTEILTDAKTGLEDVFMTDLWEWKTTHSSGNQALTRKKFFEKRA